MVKLNDNFSVGPSAEDVGGVLLSLYTALTADELAQVSVSFENAKLQLIAPPALVTKIGAALGLPGA